MADTPMKILIAEDETIIRLDLREMLERAGYDVVAEPGDIGRGFSYVPESWEPRSRNGDGPFEVACFLVDAPPGWEPELDWEHDEYRWCSTADAVELLHWAEPRNLLGEIA